MFIVSYFIDDWGCVYENREYMFIYLCFGELEIEECGKKIVLYLGDCVFMWCDNWMWL